MCLNTHTYQLIGSNLGKVKIANPVNSRILVHVCGTGLEKGKSSLKPQEILPLCESTCPLQHLAFLDFSLLPTEGKNPSFSSSTLAIFLAICFLKHLQYLAVPPIDFLKVSQRCKAVAFPCSLLGVEEAQPPQAFLFTAALAPAPWHRPCNAAAQTTPRPEFAKSALHHLPRRPFLPARSRTSGIAVPRAAVPSAASCLRRHLAAPSNIAAILQPLCLIFRLPSLSAFHFPPLPFIFHSPPISAIQLSVARPSFKLSTWSQEYLSALQSCPRHCCIHKKHATHTQNEACNTYIRTQTLTSC